MEIDVNGEYDVLEHGIAKLLGKEEPDPPTEVEPECVHASDGFTYDEGAITILLGCRKCGLQYEVSKITGLPI